MTSRPGRERYIGGRSVSIIMGIGEPTQNTDRWYTDNHHPGPAIIINIPQIPFVIMDICHKSASSNKHLAKGEHTQISLDNSGSIMEHHNSPENYRPNIRGTSGIWEVTWKYRKWQHQFLRKCVLDKNLPLGKAPQMASTNCPHQWRAIKQWISGNWWMGVFETFHQELAFS